STCFDCDRGLAAFLEQNVGNAAHAIAARARLGTVIVENAHEGIGVDAARRINRHQLVIWNPCSGRTSSRDGNMIRIWSHIDDHDLVSETVHLHKGMTR